MLLHNICILSIHHNSKQEKTYLTKVAVGPGEVLESVSLLLRGELLLAEGVEAVPVAPVGLAGHEVLHHTHLFVLCDHKLGSNSNGSG